jgi:predicted nucleic acid-binding Zn ribbon protein
MFKGSGWYINDYSSKGKNTKEVKTEKSSDKKEDKKEEKKETKTIT